MFAVRTASDGEPMRVKIVPEQDLAAYVAVLGDDEPTTPVPAKGTCYICARADQELLLRSPSVCRQCYRADVQGDQ